MAESSRTSDASLSRALALATDALAARPAGLLTDFDGTLSPVVGDPARARLVDGAAEALAVLAERLAVVAVVTGRAPLDARAMTGVPGLLIAGNHGTEWLEPGADAPQPAAAAERVRTALDAVVGPLPALAGVIVEEKGMSATLHYRNAPDPEAARRTLVEALAGLPDELEVRPGRMSLELRPIGLGDKGSAARAIVARFGLRGVVVMGDDVTDLDMFAAIDDLRAEGRLRAVIVGVGGDGHEAPPAVGEAADVLLPGPAEAAAFLDALTRRD